MKAATKTFSDTAFAIDAVPVVTLRASDAVAAETLAGQTLNRGVFTFSRTGDLTQPLTVAYTVGGTATAGADYGALSGTVTFQAGKSTATVRVTAIDDNLIEGDETVTVTLLDGAAHDLGSAKSATITLRDNETVMTPVVTVAATDAAAAETAAGQAPNPGVFSFTRTGDLSQALTVTYTVEGTASGGSDYATLSGTVTFAAGSATATVSLDALDDGLFEGDEAVTVRLTDGAAYDLGPSQTATVIIADNDPAPVVTVRASDAVASETLAGQKLDRGTFTFSRTGDLSQPLTVAYTVGGTATAGADYGALNGTVTFQAGKSTATVRVTAIDDGLAESDETVIVTLIDSATHDLGSAKSATITLRDNDAAVTPVVTVAATDAAAGEPADGGLFTFTRTGDLSQPLTVTYTVEGTAAAGTDYAALTGTVSFAAGSATATVRVDVLDDPVFEGNETVTVRLTDGATYDLGAGQAATVTIADNDPAPLVTVRASDATAAETLAGQTVNRGAFTFTRTGDLSQPLTVAYAVEGSATAGSDYEALSGSVTFAAGAATATVRLTALDDTMVEGSETVIVRLVDGTAYDLGASGSATVRIADNDTAVTPVVTVAATDAAAGEPSDGGLFTVTRTGDLSQPLTVSYTVEGTATAGSDYVALTRTVTFAAGSATASVRVDVLDDAVSEGNETVTLRLSDGAAYDLGAGQAATVTISDNDPRPDLPGTWDSTRQFGWSTTDLGEGIAVANGRVYVVGGTETNFGTVRPHPTDFGQNDGTRDGWVGFFDAATGAQAAAFQREAAPIIGPFSSGGAIYYGYINDVLSAVDADAAGNAIVVGTIAERYMIARDNDPTDPRDNTSKVIENNDIFLAKYDAAGNRLWRLEIEETLSDSAYDVAVARDGTIYVAAHLGEDEYGNAKPFGATLMKFSAEGVEDKGWRKSLDDNLTYAKHVEIDDQGTVFTAGNFTNRSDLTGDDVFVQRHKADGTTDWIVAAVQTNLKDEITDFDAGQSGVSWAVGVSTDFLAGPQPVEQWWLVRVGADGETTRFDAPTAPGEFYRLNDVEVSADGFVFVSGLVGSDGGSTVQGFVRKLDADGDLRWEVRIGDPSAAVGLTDVTFDEHGDLWVTGLTGGVGGPTAGGFDAFFARLDLDGPVPTLAGDESLGLSVTQVDAFEWQLG